MNAEQIAARRIPIEDAEIAESKSANWHCNYCSQKFQSETRFMKHYCEPKRRAEMLASPVGQAAFSFYRDWMKMRKFGQPSAPAFLESKFYRAFVNFTQLVIDANISRPDKYIEIMVDCEIQPALWCSVGAYNLYTAWYDSLHSPIDQVQESINYLMDICEKENVELSSIFDHLGVQRILSLIRQRRLSPWFLFCSAAFGRILKSLDSAHLKSFDAIVNSNYWGEKFAKEKKTISEIKALVKDIGL